MTLPHTFQSPKTLVMRNVVYIHIYEIFITHASWLYIWDVDSPMTLPHALQSPNIWVTRNAAIRSTRNHHNFDPRNLSIYPSIYVFIYLSIYRSIDLSIYPSIHPSIYRSFPVSIYLSIYLTIHLSTYPSTTYPWLCRTHSSHQRCYSKRGYRQHQQTSYFQTRDCTE